MAPSGAARRRRAWRRVLRWPNPTAARALQAPRQEATRGSAMSNASQVYPTAQTSALSAGPTRSIDPDEALDHAELFFERDDVVGKEAQLEAALGRLPGVRSAALV